MTHQPKIICIIQARRGSSRLPDKILRPLGGTPVLAHVIRRAKAAQMVRQVVVAVPNEDASDALTDIADAEGALWFKGSETDVLSRYYHAAVYEAEKSGQQADYIIRVTSDCPLLSPQVLDGMITDALQNKANYAGAGHFPHGLDCELCSFTLLKQAHVQATNPHDREHVTLWMKRQTDIKKHTLMADKNYHADNRWVLDYPEDYDFLKALFDAMGADILTASWQQIIDFINARPALRALNAEQVKLWREKTQKIIEQAKS